MLELVVYAPEKIAGKALCQLLEKRNFQPKYLQKQEDLLDAIRYGLVNVVILDMSSPMDVSRDLEDIIGDDLAVIIVTPYVLEEEELAYYKNHGFYMLEKPIILNDLTKLICQVFSKISGENL